MKYYTSEEIAITSKWSCDFEVVEFMDYWPHYLKFNQRQKKVAIGALVMVTKNINLEKKGLLNGTMNVFHWVGKTDYTPEWAMVEPIST